MTLETPPSRPGPPGASSPAPSATLSATPRTRLVRHPERGRFDRAAVHAILDEALACHVGFVSDGQPFVIPTVHARMEEWLYVHGSAVSRMLRTLRDGVPVCVTATLIDGLVLARSAFFHSMNYRSVVVLGRAEAVTDAAEKSAALAALVEHVLAGRSAEVRPPRANELAATLVLKVPIQEASAKVRTGPPTDEEDDHALDCWAGVVPLRLSGGDPVPEPRLRPGIAPPERIARYTR